MAVPDFSRRFSLSDNADAKAPNRLSVCIVLQYAKSIHIEKKLPAHLGLFIIN